MLGDSEVLKYCREHRMSEPEFYALPLPEQRQRLGLHDGENPSKPSYYIAPRVIAIPPARLH